jgi:hypothetical protein
MGGPQGNILWFSSVWDWKLRSSRRDARVYYSVRQGFKEDLPPAARMLEALETS